MPVEFDVIEMDAAPEIQVGPGRVRRDLPSRNGIRIWIVDMAAGSQWPYVDTHDANGEDILVVEGELIEGERTIAAGSFVEFAPHSRASAAHITGVRLFGFNLLTTGSAP